MITTAKPRCPRCRRRHQTWNAVARCRWPRAEWVHGAGPFATLAHCGGLTVMLHRIRAEAEQALRFLGQFGCSGRCHGRHELVELTGASAKS